MNLMENLIFLLGIFFLHWTSASSVLNVTFDLSNGTLKNVVPGAARSINLSNLHIKSIAVNALDASDEIERLDLSNNDLVDLPPFIFSKLRNLKELSLANNSISSFSNTFFGLVNLQLLDITGNRLNSLARGVFYGLSKSVKVIIMRELDWFSSGIFQKPFLPVSPKKETNVRILHEETFRKNPFSHCHFQIHITNGTLDSVELSEYKNSSYITICGWTQDPLIKLSGKKISSFVDAWFKIKNTFYNGILLSNNNIDSLTPEIFNNLSPAIKRMTFNHNRFTVLRRNDDIGNNTIDLHFRSNNISIIENGAFGKLNLLLLNLQRNHLNSTAFAKSLPTTITALWLDNNKISEVTYGSFDGLINLQTLYMRDNKIRFILPGTFSYQMNLKTLWLDSNYITELNSGYFRGLYSLQSISFSNNDIEKISGNLFHKFNPIKFELDLDMNPLKAIENGVFSYMNLSKLVLNFHPSKGAMIQEDFFKGSDICEIELTMPWVQRLNGEWFRGLSGLKNIYFIWPTLTRLDKGIAKYMKDVTLFYLRTPVDLSFENGVLFGLSTEKEVVIRTPYAFIRVIEGGLFDDL